MTGYKEDEAKEWMESEGIEPTEHRIKSLSQLINRHKLIPDILPENCFECEYQEKGFLSEPDECRFPRIELFKFTPTTGRPGWCPLEKHNKE